MDQKNKALNHFLVDVFHEILKTEEMLIEKKFDNLSMREMHVIEAVCLAENDPAGDTRSAGIAADLRITAGSLTTAVSILEKKGYLYRERSDKDKRVVRIHSTADGRLANQYHERFHESMVSDVLESLTDEEALVLIRALGKLSVFFKREKIPPRTVNKTT